MAYYQFSKKHFEYELNGICRKNGFFKPTDITNEYIAEHGVTWERIYSINTKNKSVRIIIFSSIDISTNHVRDKGSDAVRIVMEWKTKNGNVYKAIHTHYRIKTLFSNLENTLINTHNTVFELNYKEFSKVI